MGRARPARGSAIADRAPLRLGAVEAATILLVVDALFAIFVTLQLAWLFGGRDTLAMTGLTYAEYARRGFFDLVIVAVLAGRSSSRSTLPPPAAPASSSRARSCSSG